MATVTGFTAERMLTIENETVVDGDVVGDNLILKTREGTTIDAGNVRGPVGPTSTVPGPQGPKGDTGAQGPIGNTGPQGPPGSGSYVVPPFEGTAGLTYNTTSVTAIKLLNVPVIAGHRYGFRLQGTIGWASFAAAARWDIHLRVNGVNGRRFIIMPQTTGQSYIPICYNFEWVAPTTQATDDFEIYAQEVTDGADLSFVYGAGLVYSLAAIDYGLI